MAEGAPISCPGESLSTSSRKGRRAKAAARPLPQPLQVLKIKSRMLFRHLLAGGEGGKSHCSRSKTLLTKRIIYCGHLVLCLNTNH